MKIEVEKKGVIDANIFWKVHGILPQNDNAGPQAQRPHDQPEPSHQMNKSSEDHFELHLSEIRGLSKSDMVKITSEIIDGVENVGALDSSPKSGNSASRSSDETKVSSQKVNPDSITIPIDFRCPISRDLMRDPVIASTGQVRIQSITFYLFCTRYYEISL